MFPHTHVYAAKKITGRSDDLLIYGSVLPDIAITKIVDWEIVNKKTIDFKNWLADKNKKYTDLALGMMLHELPCGIDRFSHKSYKNGVGYADQNKESIIKDVAFCCGISLEQAGTVAHNCIEMGVEFLVTQKSSELIECVKNAVKNIDMQKIIEYFRQFFNTKEKTTQQAFKLYNHFLTGPYYDSIQGCIDLLVAIVKQYFGQEKEIDIEKAREIIKKSIEVVEPTYQEFLSYAINNCKTCIKQYL